VTGGADADAGAGAGAGAGRGGAVGAGAGAVAGAAALAGTGGEAGPPGAPDGAGAVVGALVGGAVAAGALAGGAVAGASERIGGLGATRGEAGAVPDAVEGVAGVPVGLLLIRRGSRVSLLLTRDGVEEDEIVLPGRFSTGAAGGAGGSSGVTSRRRPSASAFRRTRSACASSMEDEWLFTPIPRDRARSSPSLLLRPSSLASS